MVSNTTPRFSARTLESLVDVLQTRRSTLSDCAETLRSEATEANLRRDVSDLLDTQDPAADLDTETTLELARRAESLLCEVDDALQRVVAGTYGYCTGCGHSISLERLRALPATGWCIDCSSSRSARRRVLEGAS